MTKPINDFSDAKAGDKVTCYYGGHGTITNIMMEEHFPIRVTFENKTDEYTLEGKFYNEDRRPSLYKGHVEFTDPIPVKIKVKKTERRWLIVGYDSIDGRMSTDGTVYSALVDAEASKNAFHRKVNEVEISIEVDE